MGLDNGKEGDKGVELEDWMLRKDISIKKSPMVMMTLRNILSFKAVMTLFVASSI